MTGEVYINKQYLMLFEFAFSLLRIDSIAVTENRIVMI